MTSPVAEQIQQSEDSLRVGNVEFIWARNSREFLFSNSILIHGDKAILVDPSASFTFIERLAQSGQIHTVLNTHYHGDHRSLNQLFGQKVIYASHELDARAISDMREYHKVSDGDPDSFYSKWIEDTFKQYKIVECPVSLKLKEGSILNTGGEKICVVHLPGHTPGHIGLYFESIDLLYISDIDLTPHGPWYANIYSNIDDFKKSIARVKNWECRYYVTSHGERLYDRETFLKKMERYEKHFDEREERILDFLKKGPCDMATLCSQGIVYKQSSLIDPLKCYFQFKMVEKHIERLELQNQLYQDREKLVV